MTVQSKTVIKSYFETGDKPTQAQFVDLIDSYQDAGSTIPYYVDTGVTNAYVITPSPAISSYTAGLAFNIKISNANSGGSTLNVNGLGAVGLTYTDGSTLSSGALYAGAVVLVAYDGTKFQLVNITPATGGSVGTVTSAGLSMPSIFAVAGSPITTQGTFVVTLSAQAQKQVFISPASATGTPTFRTLLASDLPVSTVSAGSYTSSNLTIDAYGRIITAANGSGASAQPQLTTFTASGTFTTSSNITTATRFKIVVVGGGGGGGAGSASGAGGGGGAGATAIWEGSGFSPSTGYTVTIGAAGAAGGNGGNSSFVGPSVTVTANGGALGTAGSNGVGVDGGSGGTASNGTVNINGGSGAPGIPGAGATSTAGGNGGSSSQGGGGKGGAGGGTAGQVGQAYGSGGGGGSGNSTAAGAGKAGLITVEWFE